MLTTINLKYQKPRFVVIFSVHIKINKDSNITRGQSQEGRLNEPCVEELRTAEVGDEKLKHNENMEPVRAGHHAPDQQHGLGQPVHGNQPDLQNIDAI